MFNLAKSEPAIFYSNGGNFQSWIKPPGISMIEIFCVGAGGGGEGGYSSTALVTRYGGTSGASGGIFRTLIPASLLPDILYVQVGTGGLGGAGGTGNNVTANIAGGTGGISYVSIRPNLTNINILAASSSTVAGGGSNSGLAVGTGGTAPTPTTFAMGGLITLGNNTPLGGDIGVNAANSRTWFGVSLITGGAAGGGLTSSNGYGGTGVIFTGVGFAAIAPGSNGGGNGNSGIHNLFPFYSCGGTGGGPNNSTTVKAGDGGKGGIGSGGGGGGVSNGFQGGNGGNGGSGIVIINYY